MSKILVCPLSQVPDVVRNHRPSHLITLLSPEYMIETPEGFPPERHLKLALHDVSIPEFGQIPPDESHIAAIMDFVATWDGSQPLLVHCWAGVSRSMATAFFILCARAGAGKAKSIAWEIRDRAPHANPNRLIVRLADSHLGRNGELIRAVDGMAAAVFVEEGTLVEFPLVEFGL